MRSKAVVRQPCFFIVERVLERCSNHESYAMFMCRWQLIIIKSAYILNMYNLKYIVYT